MLSRFRIHFHAFPKMGETVTLQTWPKGVQQRLFFTRDFTLHDPQGEALAAATSAWLLINPHTRRILLPQALIDRLPDNRGRSALDMDLEKINPPDGLPERGVFEAGYSAVDVLGHANSARYLEWLSDAIGMQVFVGTPDGLAAAQFRPGDPPRRPDRGARGQPTGPGRTAGWPRAST